MDKSPEHISKIQEFLETVIDEKNGYKDTQVQVYDRHKEQVEGPTECINPKTQTPTQNPKRLNRED